MRRVVELARPWRKELRYGVASGVLQQVLFIAGAAIAAYAASRAVRGATYGDIDIYLFALVIVVLPQVRTPWLESISFRAVGARVGVELRVRLFDAVLAVAPAGLVEQQSADLAETALVDVATIERFFATTLSTLIVAGIVPALAVGALAPLAWPLALIAMPALVVGVVAPVAARRWTRAPVSRPRADLVDAIQGMREVVAFGAADALQARLASREAEARGHAVAEARARAAAAISGELARAAGGIALLAAGVALTSSGSMRPTMLAPAVVVAALAFGPAQRFADAVHETRAVVAAADSVFALLDAPVVVADPADPIALVADPAPTVEVRAVSFRYGAEQPDVLHDLEFDVPAGRMVALIGASGVGKSTTLNLLLRLWDPDAGRVCIGGVDLRDLQQADVHRLVGLVPQDVYLFNLSVRDNLRLGRPDATDAELAEAARAANAWEFIAALPEGLDTVTGERGVRLSGGQRQRLAIARVLVADPPILVLDEPAANLDTENERQISAALARVRTGRTTIVVAHRASTIAAADEVLVLDGGRVVERAPYRELSERGRAALSAGLT